MVGGISLWTQSNAITKKIPVVKEGFNQLSSVMYFDQRVDYHSCLAVE